MKPMTDKEYREWEKDYLEKEKKYEVEVQTAAQGLWIEGGKEGE